MSDRLSLISHPVKAFKWFPNTRKNKTLFHAAQTADAVLYPLTSHLQTLLTSHLQGIPHYSFDDPLDMEDFGYMAFRRSRRFRSSAGSGESRPRPTRTGGSFS